jgi:hypothetical protein
MAWSTYYYQQHDEIYKMKFIFNYQMAYPNTKKKRMIQYIWNENHYI